MRLLVLGAGGIGGYFGGRLVEGGADVTFLVRAARRAELVEQGLRIRSPRGDADLAVVTVVADELAADYDLVLLTCKAYDLPSAMEAIAPAMSASSGVLPLLNGFAHLTTLSERFGRANVLGGTAKIAVTRAADGSIRHLNDWSAVTFGEQDGRASDRILALKAAFDRTSVDASVSTDVRRDLWLKFVHLHTVAAMTSLMRANVGEIVRAPEGAALLQTLLSTNIEIARREGYPPDDAFIATYQSTFAQAASAYEASLARDIERGGPIESDHLLGSMLERCRAHELDDRIHQLAWVASKAYEQRRAADRLPSPRT
ncbi:MAG: 2-dehydropantoate 2-reductase [Candidatus Limnocylindrales bacterium]